MAEGTVLLNVYDFKAYSVDPQARRVFAGTEYEPSRTQISGVGGYERLGVLHKREAFVALFRDADRLKLVIGEMEYDPTGDEFQTSMFRWIPGLKRFCIRRDGKREVCIWYSPRIGAVGIDEDDLLETIHQVLRDRSSREEVLAQWVPRA